MLMAVNSYLWSDQGIGSNESMPWVFVALMYTDETRYHGLDGQLSAERELSNVEIITAIKHGEGGMVDTDEIHLYIPINAKLL